jgi:hypothetical protein
MAKIVKNFLFLFFMNIILFGCSSEKEYQEAIAILKIDDPEKYGKAIEILDRIPREFYYLNDLLEIANPTYDKAQELLMQIKDEFTEIRRKYIFEHYAKTRLAFSKAHNSEIVICSIDGKIGKKYLLAA